MNSFARLKEQSNKIGIEFLLTELDTAFTFLNVADTTMCEETRQRTRQRAMEAYKVVVRMQSKVTMEPRERSSLERRLAELSGRLAKLGFNVC